jgi:biopolymer transport protein ExbD
MMQTNHAGGRGQASYLGPLTQGTYWSRSRATATLNLVPMIDIFTVLVTFLLMTAVFSRITVLQLDLPSDAQSTAPKPPTFRLEVIVRETGFELTNGSKLIAAIPKVKGEYDLKTLSQLALALKRENPGTDDASILMEREVAYDHLIQVMDSIRSTEVAPADAVAAGTPELDGPAVSPVDGPQKPVRVPLFAHIAVGEAP